MRRKLSRILQELTVGDNPSRWHNDEAIEAALYVMGPQSWENQNNADVVEVVKRGYFESGDSDAVALYYKDLQKHPSYAMYRASYILGFRYSGIDRRNLIKQVEYTSEFLSKEYNIASLVGCYIPGDFDEWWSNESDDTYVRMFLDNYEDHIKRHLEGIAEEPETDEEGDVTEDGNDAWRASEMDVDEWMDSYYTDGGFSVNGPLAYLNEALTKWLHEVYDEEVENAPQNAENRDVDYACVDSSLNFIRADVAYIILPRQTTPEALQMVQKALPDITVVALQEEGGHVTCPINTQEVPLPPAQKKGREFPQKGQLDLFTQSEYEDELDKYIKGGHASSEDLLYILDHSKDQNIITMVLEYLIYNEDTERDVLKTVFDKLGLIDSKEDRERLRETMRDHPNVDESMFRIYNIVQSQAAIQKYLVGP